MVTRWLMCLLCEGTQTTKGTNVRHPQRHPIAPLISAVEPCLAPLWTPMAQLQTRAVVYQSWQCLCYHQSPRDVLGECVRSAETIFRRQISGGFPVFLPAFRS